MNNDQIKHMVDRFLRWKLPENFAPDGGVSFKAAYNEHMPEHAGRHEPVGTNLLDASQAEAMVRYILEGLPSGGEDRKAVPLNPTREMKDAGAQRLVRFEDNSVWVWPTSWDALHVASAKNEAERVWRSMWLAAPVSTGELVAELREALRRELYDSLPSDELASLRASPDLTERESGAERDVIAERRRQIEVEGWTPEHDDEHADGSLANAAAVYAMTGSGAGRKAWDSGQTPALTETVWPWEWRWFRPSGDPRRNLVKAGALILAEIERLDRAALAKADAILKRE